MKLKSNIHYLEKVSGTKREFVRLSVHPEKAQSALQALVAADFKTCGREHWLKKRKAHFSRERMQK